jgi:hypothetical protein
MIAPCHRSYRAKAASPKPVILIVDDTPETLHVLAHLFKDDYVVRVANQGEGLISVADDPPDLVLLDIMMPKSTVSK